uniref:ATPase_AAA_core domain-containing protein n=1 Tax=Strongyloides papillosus TaxID=174720 RepID=A0A0N5CIX9_STREA
MNSNFINLSSISSVVDSYVASKFCQKTTIYILKMLNKLCITRKLVPSFLLLDEVCSLLKFGENVDKKEFINILQNIVWTTKIKIEKNDVSALKLIASKLLKVNKHSVGESFNDEKYNIFSIKNKNFIGESDGDYITTKTSASTSAPIKNSISLSSNKPSSTISSNPIDSNLQCSTTMLPLTNSNNFDKSELKNNSADKEFFNDNEY